MDTVPANSTRTLDCCEPLGGNYKMRKSILARTGFGLDRVMILDAFPYFCVVFVQKAQHTQVISVRHLISGQTLSRDKLSPHLMSSRVFLQQRNISVRLQRSEDVFRKRDTSNLGRNVYTLRRCNNALAYPKIALENQTHNIVHPPLP